MNDGSAVLVSLVGLAVAAIGLLGVVAPVGLTGLLNSQRVLTGLPVTFVVRIITGSIFVIAAPGCRVPTLVHLFGLLEFGGEVVWHIGKESNLLEEQQHGVIHCDPQTVFSTGGDLEALRVWLRRVPAAEVARLSGVSESMIRAIRNGNRNPSDEKLAAIEWALSRIPDDQ